MKGLKKIGLAALTLAAFVGLASCSTGSNEAASTSTGASTPSETSTPVASSSTSTPVQTSTTEEEIIPGVIPTSANVDADWDIKTEMADTDKIVAISASAVTKYTKTVYYLGDELNTDGLYLSRILEVQTEGGTTKERFTDNTTEFSVVNRDDIDLNTVGTYIVQLKTRVGTSTTSASYTIEVRSSLFETTKGLTYAAGLDVKFEDGTFIKEYVKGTTVDKDNLINNLKVKSHTYTVSNSLVLEDKVTDLALTDVEISEEVKPAEVGTYYVKVTYKGKNVTVDKTEYENTITSFVIISIINPVTEIQFSSRNTTKFDATLEDLDFSGWKIKVTYQTGETANVDFTSEMFSVEGLDVFDWGSTQTITIIYNENPSITTVASVQIQASETQTVTKYTELYPATLANEDGTYNLANTDFIIGPIAQKIDGEVVDGVSSGATYESGRAEKAKVSTTTGASQDMYGALKFDERITIKGESQAITLNLDAACDIAAFYSSSGDEVRDLVLVDSKGEEVVTLQSSEIKQDTVKGIIHVPAAGTYKLYNPNGGMYIHGLIIAK